MALVFPPTKQQQFLDHGRARICKQKHYGYYITIIHVLFVQ